MHKLISIILMALCVTGVSAQQTRKLTAEKHNDYGLVYTLPKTAFAVTVTAQKQTKVAGPYALYAKKYLGTDQVITEDSQSWRILNVQVDSYGIPDRSKEYNMQLKPGALTYICVDNNGMLLAINTMEDNREGDSSFTKYVEPKKGVDPKAYLKYVTEDFLSSQSTAKQAQMLAESLMEVREAKLALTRGTADNMPTDGKGLELMLNSLNEQEQAMTAAFTGSYSEETFDKVYNYVPGEEGSQVLMRISDFDGFTDADDMAGEPLTIDIKVIERPEYPVDEKGREKALPRDAVAYTIPGTARVTLTYLGRRIYQEDSMVAQFGITYGLAPSLFTDKKSPSYATFDPATGAIDVIGPVSELNASQNDE